MFAQPLKVLVVDADRALLRHISKLLDVLGYNVRQAVDVVGAMSAVEADIPNFLITAATLESATGVELCRAVRQLEPEAMIYTLLVIQRHDPPSPLAAMEAGIDDFLAKPLVYGEVMARLRAGARALEYQRRVRDYVGADFCSGVPSPGQFRRHLRAEIGEEDGGRRVAVAMLDLDYFGRVSRNYGREIRDAVLAEAAIRIREICQPGTTLAYLGGNRFACSPPVESAYDPKDWAEEIRRGIAETEFTAGKSAIRLTASVGVAQQAGSPDERIDSAEACLKLAKISGRNCVICDADLNAELMAWNGLAAPGKLFDRTVARDVMTPCTVALDPNDAVGGAAAIFEQTGLTGIPVVEKDGTLIGLANRKLAESMAEADPSRHVRDVMAADVEVMEEDTEFDVLMASFTGDDKALVVIVDERRPTGFITRGSLAALSEPLTSQSFTPQTASSGTSDDLLVPDLCPIDDG